MTKQDRRILAWLLLAMSLNIAWGLVVIFVSPGYHGTTPREPLDHNPTLPQVQEDPEPWRLPPEAPTCDRTDPG